MASGYVYSVSNGGVAISTSITILQIKAGNTPLELLRVTLTQQTSTTSAMDEVAILRKTAAATVTSVTPKPFNSNDPVSLAVGGATATGVTATAEGTDGNVLHAEAFNVLNGWTWLPTPEERIWVPSTGIIAVKFQVNPASATYYCTAVFREWQ
jgi:hypothetical protein